MFRVLTFLVALLAAPLAAEDSRLRSLETGNDAAGWEAVGRLDIDGKGFCTAALIAPDLVLTAAHCLFDRENGTRVSDDRIEFLVGFRNGRALAYRGVRASVVHEGYSHLGATERGEVRYDLALLQLDRPVRNPSIAPFEVSQSRLPGTRVGVVSYAADRDAAPSLQETCEVLGQQQGVLVMSCDVNFGSSGAPVFRNENGVYRLVSVVSAMADLDGERVSLGTDLAAPIAELQAALAAEPGVFDAAPTGVRVLRPGERTDTGARFVRP